jgi:hypothetical protein
MVANFPTRYPFVCFVLVTCLPRHKVASHVAQAIGLLALKLYILHMVYIHQRGGGEGRIKNNIIVG